VLYKLPLSSGKQTFISREIQPGEGLQAANSGTTQVREHFLKAWITTPLSEKMKMVEFEWRTPIIYCA